jgi:Domain of unknown function (DUF4279)/SEC-C motif
MSNVRPRMPRITKSVATLRVFGDELIPELVSALLGATPTDSYRKGEVKLLRGGKELIHKTGMWRLGVPDREPEDLDGQVSELLAGLTPDLDVWRDLTELNQVDLFCGLFMDESNEGFGLSVSTLSALAERGIELDLDVYAPSKELTASEPCPCGSGKTYGECCAPKSEA